MQLQIQTSTSSPIPVKDIQYIYDLARCSRCSIFALIKSTNKLYGANDEFTSIHEIDVPFLVNTDLIFRIDQFPSTFAETEIEYFIPSKFNWVLLPTSYWEMYINGDIAPVYHADKDQFILYDNTTKWPIHDQIQLHQFRDCNDFIRKTFLNQLEGFFARQFTLNQYPEVFTSMQDNEFIRKVYDNKVYIGRVLCRLANDNIDVAFYIFKSMFPLAKMDTLEIEIRFDMFQKSAFMVTFKPKKKKNPVRFNRYGVPYSEKIHCMYVNLV